MKDLLKIYLRYILTAAGICILLVTLNLALLFAFFVRYSGDEPYQAWRLSDLSAALTRDAAGNYSLPEEVLSFADSRYSFLMLLNNDGQVVWSRNLPDDIPRSYSLSQVASFTRWYLQDYPVNVWTHSDGLLVAARPRNSIWKQDFFLPLSLVDSIPQYLLAFILCNLLLIFTLTLLCSYRFYASLRPIAEGIERLNSEKALFLPEGGMAGSLARALNQTSRLLQNQKEALEKRDRIRTEWIAGVSHDIRTPLSLIMGHADALEQDAALTEEQKKKALSIKENSLQIKQLIQDLNLTSRLEYGACPLRPTVFSPAHLLRALTASCLNNALTEPYSLELILDPGLEKLRLTGDVNLLNRALHNLIGNSIRHNPAGCEIRLFAGLAPVPDGAFLAVPGSSRPRRLEISVSDTGCGIPLSVIQALCPELFPGLSSDGSPSLHIMGLRIARQIARIHGGDLTFLIQENSCHTVLLWLPLPAVP